MASPLSVWQSRLAGWWRRITGSVARTARRSDTPDNQTRTGRPGAYQRKGQFLLWGLGLLFFALVFSTWLWWRDRDYQALYGRNESFDTAAVMECLQRENISYRLHPDSGQVLVHAGDIAAARMALATSGIVVPVRGQSAQPEKGSTLGTSHFMERTRQLKNLEDELSLSIQGIDAVRFARVHLAVPEQSTFLRDTPGARASVSLDIYQGQSLSRAQIKGIMELVAGSVAGMESTAVAVVDQSGKLLSAEVSDLSPAVSTTSQQLAVRSQVEQHLENQVGKLVEAITGPGNYRVDVAIELDFSNQESAWEDYGPDGGILRSESVSGAPVNQTSDVATATGSASIATSTEGPQVRNYEVNRSVNRIVRSPGRLLRISVAVLLNYRSGNSGEPVSWGDDEIIRVKSLVERAVGYKEERADQVTVSSMLFYQPAPAVEFSMMADVRDEMLKPIFQIVAAIMALLLLFIITLLMSLRKRKRALLQAEDRAVRDKAMLAEERTTIPEEVVPEAVSDVQLEARKRQLVQYARDNPDRVAMVLKKWMSGDDER
ncbi:flagellar M-ring protein FliF [Sansalvadorimonas sp. 2012CJ34-2]|uniref:Flagellar M-ring protein n=1 Tax=Parendozoicomonas callyspongiae TaxID=2942213 RepID=A0ABT0PE65_9GAMM|nr:flagellar basal-body MS-ring/collar protein FliF [Sansalvadorimonas sp. 2012CJ34-2]MCL6269541.1 flagellar M-ring protein FliF [Sansalvadorimonas sp. 2012CJ34-2]